MTRFDLGPWRELQEGVFVAQCQPEGVNLGLVVGSDACLLVDTGSSPWQGAEIRGSVAQLTSAPLTTVVITHSHYDHAFGLAAFRDLEVFGHASLGSSLRSPAAQAKAEELRIDPDDIRLPNRPITLLAAKDLGASPRNDRKRWVEISHFGPGHTAGDLVVLVPDARVLFAGDLVEQSGPPQIGPDSVVAQWPKALDAVMGMLRPDTMVVPGHGEVLDRMDVLEQRGAIGATYAQCEWLRNQGVGEADAYGHPELEWPYTEEWARAAIAKSYAELAVLVPRPVRTIPLTAV